MQNSQPPTLHDSSPEKQGAAKISETTAILSRLLSSFPERDSDDGNKLDRIRSYLVALEGFSVSVLEEVERRILKAKVPELDPRFMPTPPQLARLCDEIQALRNREALPKAVQLERFMAPPDPNVVLKFERVKTEFAKEVDRMWHESRADFIRRMGHRIKPLAG